MTNAVLPGVYVETIAGKSEESLGVRGVVAMPLALDWGAEYTEVEKGANTLLSLGYRPRDLKLVNEVMKYADRLILYRTNSASGTAAQGSVGTNLIAKAVCNGARGNEIRVTVSPLDGLFTVKTYLGTEVVDTQTVSGAADFKPNGFIRVEGEGELSEKSVTLTGGASGEAAANAVDAFLTELEKREYNVIAYTGTEADSQQKIAAFVDRMRGEGTMVQAVLSGSGHDDPAIYNCTVGGRTADYTLTAAEACATLAGIVAGCGPERSMTHFELSGWTDVSPRLTKAEMEARVLRGEAVFALKYGRAVALYDRNSLVTYTDRNPADFGKGLVVRTLDQYAMDLQKLLDTRAVGKIRNSADGRGQIKGMICEMTVRDYLDRGWFEDFSADDVTVSPGAERDGVTVTVGIHIVDTVDKIYLTVTAR